MSPLPRTVTLTLLVLAFPLAGAASGLSYQTGDIPLLDGKASLHTGSNLRYLGAADARRVIADLWGNPPEAAADVLGLIVPAGLAPEADGSWAVAVTQTEDGHVSDDDAGRIDYDRLLGEMRSAARDTNAEREAAGYGTVDLVGWAETPRYDAAAHKLYWAKELAFHTPGETREGEHTLNYAVRVLGRDRVLELNAVAGMGQLGQVKRGCRTCCARSPLPRAAATRTSTRGRTAWRATASPP